MAKKFVRVPGGDLEGLYQLKRWHERVDISKVPPCPCCTQALRPVFDICQWGMFEDEYTTFFVCKPCGSAWKIVYRVPTYEMVSRSEQRRLGLLQSKSHLKAKRPTQSE